jgi:hypothetical protein
MSCSCANDATKKCVAYALLAMVLLTCGGLSVLMESSPSYITSGGEALRVEEHTVLVDVHSMVPQQLVEWGVYDPENDFVNSIGKRPAFWELNNSHSWGPCYPEPLHTATWKNVTDLQEPYQYKYRHDDKIHKQAKTFSTNVAGGCRPGFVIIGAGKCGTSSLYHYLTGHPRVAPAYAKQIHYFKVSQQVQSALGREM